ncbi:MAG: TetR/AcrR family transcriptional regulator [Kiritimatiellia bacterium]|jgi:AcrR family transcriptional regulator
MQQRAVRTREIILNTAREMFSAKGFDGARIDEIANAAGINKQRIYAYFNNKAGLFTAVLKASFATLFAEEQRLLALGPEDLAQLPEEILTCYFDIHERHPEIWRLLAWENLAGAKHAESLAGLQEPIYAHIGKLYRLGQERGNFDKDIPFEAFVFTLLAVAYFMESNRRTLAKSLGLDLSTRRKRDQLGGAILRLISHQRP